MFLVMLSQIEVHENKILVQADDDCRAKDKELSELLERMSQYEGVSYLHFFYKETAWNIFFFMEINIRKLVFV